MSLSIQNLPAPYNCLVVGLNVSQDDDLINHLLSHKDILESHNFKQLRKCSLLKSDTGMPDEVGLTNALSEQQPDLIVLAYEVQRPLQGVDTILHDHLRDRLRDVTPVIIYADINVSASKVNFQDDDTRGKLHGQMEEFCKRVFTHTKIKDKYWAAVVVKRHHVRSKNFEKTIQWAARIARKIAERRQELSDEISQGRLSARLSAAAATQPSQRSRQHSRRISVDVTHPWDTDSSLQPNADGQATRIRYDSSVGRNSSIVGQPVAAIDQRKNSTAATAANESGGRRYFEHQFRQEVLDNLKQLILSFDKQSIANWTYSTNPDGFVEELTSEMDTGSANRKETIPVKYKLPKPVAEHLVRSLLSELQANAKAGTTDGGSVANPSSTKTPNRTSTGWA